jgi:DNA repair protein RadC
MAEHTHQVPIYRVALVREGTLPCEDDRIRSALMASRLLHTYLRDADREHFVVILLDQKHGVIGINTVSIGSLSGSTVHPREVFKPAILANAAAIICGHNHPSGAPNPSQDDRAITHKLVQAGKLLGIDVLDHVIIGAEGCYFSFADEGLIDMR